MSVGKYQKHKPINGVPLTDNEIIKHMSGNIADGHTIEEEIELYRSFPHYDYEFEGGCICVADIGKFYVVAFAWCDNTITARKNFLSMTDDIYQNGNKPFIFSGKKNYFSGRSVQIHENVWQYSPKSAKIT